VRDDTHVPFCFCVQAESRLHLQFHAFLWARVFLQVGQRVFATLDQARADLTRNTRAPHFTPQHWLLCHMDGGQSQAKQTGGWPVVGTCGLPKNILGACSFSKPFQQGLQITPPLPEVIPATDGLTAETGLSAGSHIDALALDKEFAAIDPALNLMGVGTSQGLGEIFEDFHGSRYE